MDQLAERKLEVQSPVERARSLSDAIAAAADEIEATQEIPEPLLSDIFRLGLFRLLLPRSVEGEEAHPVAYLDALMEVARQDGSVAWNMFVANSATLIAPFLPLETARTIWADPRTVICWGPPNACRLKA
ncbi:MAG: acyl-CoA dehydrogenase family protein, partial [Alphaproteobacteria bacterium]